LSEGTPPAESRAAIPRPEFVPQLRTRVPPPPVPVSSQLGADDFHETLRRGFLPKRGGTAKR
jgi:hypothetical protein